MMNRKMMLLGAVLALAGCKTFENLTGADPVVSNLTKAATLAVQVNDLIAASETSGIDQETRELMQTYSGRAKTLESSLSQALAGRADMETFQPVLETLKEMGAYEMVGIDPDAPPSDEPSQFAKYKDLAVGLMPIVQELMKSEEEKADAAESSADENAGA